MAERLCDAFDDAYVDSLAEKLAAVTPDFAATDFRTALHGKLAALPFLARMDTLAAALNAHLPGNFAAKTAAFRQIWGAELPGETGMFSIGGWLWPIARYAEHHGNEDFSTAVAFIRDLTCRHTGEFAVRPLLVTRPDAMLAIMTEWSHDPSVHVRRLASEGLRIRLPWAKKLTLALERFNAVRVILSTLKEDTSRFVQKSVGNNLNDLYKEAPALAEALVSEWETAPTLSAAARWVIRHGRRNFTRTCLSTPLPRP
ncbi:MAG: DNA alkylation repair protein [Zoogloeaceae bacterium]|jgi:3-methyladenine DNA glycosylase AlkC|nr:DNA alkylation repair protein [Zoogloeaceae bacterium]